MHKHLFYFPKLAISKLEGASRLGLQRCNCSAKKWGTPFSFYAHPWLWKEHFFSLFMIYGPWRYCLMRKIERFVVVLLVCYPSERLLGPAVSCNLPCLCFPLFPCLLSVFLPLLYLRQNTKSKSKNSPFIIAENTSADLRKANRET